MKLFAKTVGIKLSAKKHTELAQRLIDGVDLRTPSQDLMDMAGLKAEDLNGMDVIDVIQKLADKKGDISKMQGRIIDCLRPLMPRAYSIASSSKTSNDKVDLLRGDGAL